MHNNKFSENLIKYFLRKILVNTCFGKVADPQPANLSKKRTPLQVYFNKFDYI